MKIIFYDDKELVLPKIMEDMPDSDFDKTFHYTKGDSRTIGSYLVDFINSDCSQDAEKRLTQVLFRDVLDYCVSINPYKKEVQKLSPKQRLLLYQRHPIGPKVESLEKIKTASGLKVLTVSLKVVSKELTSMEEKDIYIVEMVECNIDESIFYHELVKMVINNIYVKECERCGRYFLIEGRRKNVKYCNEIPEGATHSCSQLAARHKYEQKLEKDPVTKAYRSAYKKYNQRVRNKKWDKSQFMVWADAAKDKLKQAQAGEITEEEFLEWLKGDI